MAGNYTNLKDLINNPTQYGLPAWDNDAKQIEGTTIQQYLLTIINSLTVGYQFMGVASENTSGGTPDQNVFYLAGAGTYNGFGSNPITIDAGYIGIIRWNGAWNSDTIKIADVVSVSLNIQTGHTDINIGGNSYPVASIEEVNQLYQQINGATINNSTNNYTPFHLSSGKTYRVTNLSDTGFAVYFRIGQDSEGQIGILLAAGDYKYIQPSVNTNYIYSTQDISVLIEDYDSIIIKEENYNGTIKALASINSLAMGNDGVLSFNGRIYDPTWIFDNSSHRLFAIKGGDAITIKANSYQSQYAFLSTYRIPKLQDPVPFCAGTSRQTINANVEISVTAPQDALFLYVTESVNGTNYLPVKILINGKDPFYSNTIRDLINDAFPNGVLSYNAANKQFVFYSRMGKTYKYVGFNVALDENNGDNVFVKMWRLVSGDIYQKIGNTFVKIGEAIDTGENEMAMHFKDCIDYTGGFHGDERIDISPLSFVKFFADGVEITETQMQSSFELVCSSFAYMQLSSLHETSKTEGQYVEGHPIVALHYKRNTFANGESDLTNTIKMVSPQIVTQYHAGLWCTAKYCANYAIIPSTVKTPQLTGTNQQYNADNFEDARIDFWNPNNAIRCSVEGEFKQGFDNTTDIDQFQVWDRVGDSKYYRRFVGEKSFSTNGIIRNHQIVKYY